MQNSGRQSGDFNDNFSCQGEKVSHIGDRIDHNFEPCTLPIQDVVSLTWCLAFMLLRVIKETIENVKVDHPSTYNFTKGVLGSS